MITLSKIKISERNQHAGGYSPVKDGKKTFAIICCPGCRRTLGRVGSGEDSHEIKSNGDVKPSIVCKYCGFHDFVKLKGWKK